jgi:sialate O-acetylesterase
MPRSAFACRPELQTRLDNFDRQVKQYFEVGLPHHLKDLEKYLADHPKNDAAKLDIPIPAPPVNPGHVPTNPTTCFNGMVASVAPYPIKGILYYQDARSQNDAWLYRYIFDEIIQDYRKLWNNPDLPFVFAQTTPVGKPVTIPGESRWAELRESQLYRFKKIRNTGMAVGIDAGGDDDVEPIPRSKEKLSKRLAWAALGLFYDGVEQMPSGPIYDGHRINNERVTIQFTYTGKGLMPVFKESDKERKLRGFTICGEDRKWVVADARIEGDTVVVSSPSVPRPVAVRYAWADNPADANLYNKDGLPASPFRTDTFKLTTQP